MPVAPTMGSGMFWGWPWLKLGSCWRHGLLWEVLCGKEGVLVSAYADNGLRLVIRECFPDGGYSKGESESASAMVNKYITAVKQRSATAGKASCECDPAIAEGRPALTAFLTETDAGDGRVRERSVLMVCVDEAGTRVGLKASEFNGWIWRTARTLTEGLDAVEKALTDPEASFRPAGGRKGPRGRKKR